ncbi:hypothetical protein IC744_01765 [Microbacterium hominis]|uniref:hypothetical protein n=1 Tax=Microbacterium hominis TaxID=162426 RepID=UPI00168AC3EC|nr:hypothetical protein [Microbacterium hominis]QOC29184.1 hypothetical protein IC744_01765 [Microbacterium hominis]
MKHITFSDKSLLMDDEAADCLLEYARHLGNADTADVVTVRAISPDGNTVDAAFLLNARSTMLVETTNSVVEPPDNTEAIAYMRERLELLRHPLRRRQNIDSTTPCRILTSGASEARQRPQSRRRSSAAFCATGGRRCGIGTGLR